MSLEEIQITKLDDGPSVWFCEKINCASPIVSRSWGSGTEQSPSPGRGGSGLPGLREPHVDTRGSSPEFTAPRTSSRRQSARHTRLHTVPHVREARTEAEPVTVTVLLTLEFKKKGKFPENPTPITCLCQPVTVGPLELSGRLGGTPVVAPPWRRDGMASRGSLPWSKVLAGEDAVVRAGEGTVGDHTLGSGAVSIPVTAVGEGRGR